MKAITPQRVLGYFRKRRDDNQSALILKQYSEIEADSAWQYLQAIDYTSDKAIKQTLFKNVLEERNHADIFARLSELIATEKVSLIAKKRKQLISQPEELSDFLAYVHYGEAHVHQKFLNYANTCRDERISKAFRKISDDEEDHEAEIFSHLIEVVGSEKEAIKKVKKAKFKQFFEAWTRQSEKIGNVIFGTLLSIVFWLFGLIVKRPFKQP